ncbi:MAG TPA: PEP/pyruvate-binding domain-containing protein [Vicinamibacterales bacterium]|nr:PEP/pyruvate-binding domain-containing protein [Vicinamibacterales bacterium]
MTTFVDTFKTLDAVVDGDLPRIGGKAFNCARLKQAGVPVPDGIVVPSDATDEEIRTLGADAWLAATPADSTFAVRSSGLGEDSAGHSFAGIHETHLNVAHDQVAEAVLVCRRSAQSEQARVYRQARNLGEEDARIGILVQRMVPAVVSGVAFTVNPITGADELVINAAPGLGEDLVSGRVDPDEYRVSKGDRSLLSSRLGARNDHAATALLSASQIDALAALLANIETIYRAPQDVEWCHDGHQFWIVQSRPVTTTNPDSRFPKPDSRRPDSRLPDFRLPNPDSRIPNPDSRIPNPEVEWTRANLAEVLPDQLSPQALDLYVRILNEGERSFFGRLMAPESELGPIVKAFHGRLYFNLAQLRHVTDTVGAAFADTLRSLGHAEQIRPEDEIARRPQLRRLLRALPDIARLVRRDIGAPKIFAAHERSIDAALARLAADPRTLTDAEIRATFQWWISIIPESIVPVLVMSNVQGREDILRKACRRVGFSYDRLVYPQLAAGERSVSSQQAFDLVALADAARGEKAAAAYLLQNDGTFADFRAALAGTAFLRAFEAFLDRYGHRGRYESDWAIPRLSENPAPLLFAIRGQLEGPRQDPEETARRQEADAAAAWREFEARLTTWQRWTLPSRVRSTLRRLKQQYVWREKVRSDLTRVLARLRVYHLTLAQRFVERGWLDSRDDYFLLHFEEVGRAVADSSYGQQLSGIALDRAAQLAAERDLRMPLFMRESELEALLRRTIAGSDGAAPLTGLCVSPGSVEAEVVVMRDPSEFVRMKRGAILVAPATDPSWTPLFTLASGVIVEVGGMLSHASTIAREYGLPALANVKRATSVLQNGVRVRLDASGGRVVML